MSESNSSAPAKGDDKQLLSVKDIKKGLTYVVTRGSDRDAVSASDFEILFEAKAKTMGWLNESETFKKLQETDIAKSTAGAVNKLVDTGSITKVTAKDFETMFNKQLEYLDKNAATIDQMLPVAGQAGFGILVGFLVGTAARSLYQYKFAIAFSGVCVYSGLQYLAQEQFINQQQIQAAVQKKLKDALDANKDGDLTREDLELLIEKKMKIVNTKLGPGGFLPGAAGYTTFALGMLFALRRGARRF